MTRFQFVLPSVLLFAGCAASDQEAKVSHTAERTVVSQSKVPVSHDEGGNPFIEVKGEMIAVDFNGQNSENDTQLFVTESIDSNGRTIIGFGDSTSPTVQQ